MSKSRVSFILIITLWSAGAAQLFAQTVPPATRQQEAKLIALLKSDAPHKEKADACRQLAVIGTRDAIAPLAALLGDEKLSHMARYGLEPIRDPAVDDAFRDALSKLRGRPLVGVIGSVGVRRDAKAVGALAKMLQDADAEVAQAAARALGKIGNQRAAAALRRALANASAGNQLALCEGLFRCAEILAAKKQRGEAIEIYDQLRKLDAPHQVRGGALRGAILTRENGVTLLRQHLRSDDYILFSAAVQAAQELLGAEVTEALTAVINKLPTDNQILVILALGKRADPAALPALFALARSGEKPVRLGAIRALPEIGHASAVPVLVRLLSDADREIGQAAQESLAALPGERADAAVMAMLSSSESARRLVALELIGRRRIVASIVELLRAASDADPKVRAAAIRMVGELGGSDQLPALLDLLMNLKTSQDLDAARQALSSICAKADDPESCTKKLAGTLPEARPAQKAILLRVLSAIGGNDALKAVRGAVDDPDAGVRAAAIRALSAWKDADAAPILLRLAEKADNPNDKTLCLRGYLGFAGRPDLPADQRLSMCQQAAGLVERDDEKKLLLGALGSIESPEALALVVQHLDEPGTQEEAAIAVVAIAEKLLKGRRAATHASRLIEPLEKVVQVTTNADLARRAKVLLRQARSKARSR